MNIRTYEVRTENGEMLRIQIPSNWKVTYGPVTMAAGLARRAQNQGRGTWGQVQYCLRVYENDDKQRIIIPDVVSFRDMSVPVQAGRTIAQADGDDFWFDGAEIAQWQDLEFVPVREMEGDNIIVTELEGVAT